MAQFVEIRFRCSEDQHEAIKQRAESVGLNIGAYARMATIMSLDTKNATTPEGQTRLHNCAHQDQ